MRRNVFDQLQIACDATLSRSSGTTLSSTQHISFVILSVMLFYRRVFFLPFHRVLHFRFFVSNGKRPRNFRSSERPAQLLPTFFLLRKLLFTAPTFAKFASNFFFWFPSFFGKISRFASSRHCDVTHRCRSALHPHTSFLLADRIRLPCTPSHSNSMQWNRTDRLMNNKVHLIFIKRRENSLTSLFFWRTRRRFTRCSQLIDFHSAVRCTIKFV